MKQALERVISLDDHVANLWNQHAILDSSISNAVATAHQLKDTLSTSNFYFFVVFT